MEKMYLFYTGECGAGAVFRTKAALEKFERAYEEWCINEGDIDPDSYWINMVEVEPNDFNRWITEP